MNNNEQLNKLIEASLQSLDDAQRASPRPYLMTRIQARMNKVTETAWEKAGRFIARPAVAFTGLCILLAVNAMVVVFKKPADTVNTAEQVTQSPADEFSYTVATIYDFENTQPNDK